MKKILLIGTGGTIASRKTASGLAPQLPVQELLDYVPAAREICRVEPLQLFSIDSTNIQPENWLQLARAVREHYAQYDGFVVCHGTDTMAYTAAALSYLIRDPDKPVVVTGAQKPIDADETDARVNLLDSLRWACTGIGGVCIVFGGQAIVGTRARKSRSKSYNAFSSINFPVLGVVRNGRVVPFFPSPRAQGPFFSDALDPRVSVLKLTPGMAPGTFSAVGDLCDALVVESYGVGGIPAVYDAALARLHAAGKTVVVGTQVPHEGSDLAVYQVGERARRRYALLETCDMTLESTVVKLMWVLAQTRVPAEIRRLFYTEVNHDILIQPVDDAL